MLKEKIEREVRREVEARLAQAAAVPIHASSVGTAPVMEELEAQQPSTSEESHGALQDSVQMSSPVSRAMEMARWQAAYTA